MRIDTPFSPAEFKIIAHRLELDQCVAECLPQWNPESISGLCFDLLRPDLAERDRWKREMIFDVIEDAIAGSTFFACAESAVAFGEISPQQFSAYERSAQAIERKFTAWTGRSVSLPRC